MRAISVLLLEDVATVRTLWLNQLTRAGFIVDAAASCAEAVGLIQRKAFEVFVFDHELLDGKGVDVLRYARHHGSDTPAIIVSGVANRQDVIEAGNWGAIRFLAKPLETKLIAAAIREVAAAAAAAAAAVAAAVAAAAAAAAAETESSPIAQALGRISVIDLCSVDAGRQCLSIVLRLMGDTRVDLAEFAMLAAQCPRIARQSPPLDVSGVVRVLGQINQGTLVSDPQTRGALDCIAVSAETRPERLALACRVSEPEFLALLRWMPGHDVRYWTRMARIRRGLRLVCSGDSLDYAAEVSGFAHSSQMSRDIADALGATVTEIRAAVLGTFGRRMG